MPDNDDDAEPTVIRHIRVPVSLDADLNQRAIDMTVRDKRPRNLSDAYREALRLGSKKLAKRSAAK